MRVQKDNIDKIKKAEEIFEEAYQKGFFGARALNVSEVYRLVEYPGSMGGFHKDVWGAWKKRKLKQLSKEENNG